MTRNVLGSMSAGSCLAVMGLLVVLHGLAVSAAAQTIIRVADHGALADDGQDDSAAMERALNAARQVAGPVEVVMDAGVYHLSRQGDAEAGLRLYSLREVTLRGVPGRTELRVMTYMLPAIILRDCVNVTVRGVSIDYDPLPFTQGPVTAVSADEGWFEFKPMPGYPDPSWSELRPGRGFGMRIDIAHRRPADDWASALFLDRWERAAAPGVWRVYPQAEGAAHALRHFAVGDGYVHLARDGFAALPILDSGDCTLEDVTIHSAAAPAFMLMGNHGRVTLRRCAVRFAPHTDRWITTDGDGVHAPSNRVGPLIEDCYFEGMADDGVNVYVPPMHVRQVVSPQRLTVSANGRLQPGDRVQVFNPASGRVLGTTQVAQVVKEGDGLAVTLDAPVADVAQGDSLFNLDRSGRGLVIRNTTFAPHRGRSILLRGTEDGLIEHNTLRNFNATYAISVANEPTWPEGPMPVGGLTIRGNTIRHASLAGIQIMGFALQGPSPTAIGRYRIEDNDIRHVRGAAIHLGQVEHAIVRGNRVADVGMPLAADRWERLETDVRP